MQRPLRTYLILIQERIDRSWNKSEKLKSVPSVSLISFEIYGKCQQTLMKFIPHSRIVHLYTTHGIFCYMIYFSLDWCILDVNFMLKVNVWI